MKNLMQALDLFGARSRNRTGTSFRTGDFKSENKSINISRLVENALRRPTAITGLKAFVFKGYFCCGTKFLLGRHHFQALAAPNVLLCHANSCVPNLIPCIAEQLESIEDSEEVPGTEREWRDYRIQVRAWKQGAEGFPDSDKRPARPSC